MTAERAEESSGDFIALLRSRARERQRTLAYPEGLEPRVLNAVAECLEHGLVRAVLFGDRAEVEDALAERGFDADAVGIVDPTDEVVVGRTLEHVRQRRAGRSDPEEELTRMARDPLFQAGAMLAEGTVDGVVAGSVRTTADVVRAGLVSVGLADGIRRVSSAFYMVFGRAHPFGPKVLTFTDAGVVPMPTAEQLASIAAAAAAARARIVGDEPRVAFLSYSTKGSAEGPSVTLAREALAGFRRLMPHVAADGELQGDAALSPTDAQR